MEKGITIFSRTVLLYYKTIVNMNKRSALDSQAAKKRDLALLRKKNDKMEPIFNVEREESPLFNTVTMSKEM